MKEKKYYVYIMTNQGHTVLYVGITNSLIRRLAQHDHEWYENSFTSKYNIYKLVYFEIFGDASAAIGREKQLKAGSRQKKLDLINDMNPDWRDLMDDIW